MPSTGATAAPAVDTRLRYLPGVDGLRAVSVIAVLLYHFDVRATPGGFLGVEVFFVISGYLITSLLLAERRRSGRVNLRRFWIRRARRLLPALLVFLAVTCAYALLFLPDAIETLRGDVVAAIAYVSNWWQIAADRSYFVQAGRPPLLLHLWSLGIEEQFYLLWPPILVLALARFRRHRVALAAVGAAVASAVLMALLFVPYTDPSRVYYGTDTRASGLLLGSAFAFAWTPERLRGRPGRGAGFVVDVAGVVGLVVLAWFFLRVNDFDPFVYRGGFLLVGVATVLVIAASVHPSARLGSVLGWEPLRAIGLRSYGIYLWHWPVRAVTRPGVDVPIDGLPLLALRFAISFGLAELSYRYVERPVRSGAIGDYVARMRDARGAVRTRLATRGAFASSAAVVVAVSLAWGLLTATAAPASIPGIDVAALEATADDTPAEAIAPDPEPPPRPTTTTVPGPEPGEPPEPVPVGDPGTIAIGDSVMLGAQAALEAELDGIHVDAKVSRQFHHAIPVLEWYAQHGFLREVLVLHLGTNGAVSAEQIDEMMTIVGDDRHVVFVNTRVPRPWEGAVNGRLAEGAERWPNAHLADWHDLSADQDDWFATDGFHVGRTGAEAYAALIGDAARAAVAAATGPGAEVASGAGRGG